jgi:release factor glutamine methyltransferase
MSEATEQQWTIKRLLDWTDDYFSKAESLSPRLEAEILLSEALSCARIDLYTRFDEVPDAKALSQFREWVKRRAAGEPVAYVVGYREFYSLRFQVNNQVLIPRPETEHVVVSALEAVKSIEARPLRIMDIGTGSGCIAVTLAKHIDDCQIAATDLSDAALQVARTNAEAHGVSEQVRFLSGDLFEALPSGSGPVHMIVSNPPYIGTSEIETVEQPVRDHEPDLALFAGEHGIEIISRLIAGAASHLLPGGFLIFEISPIIVETCSDLIKSASELELVEIVKDFSGLERVVVARKMPATSDGISSAERHKL